MNAKKRGASSSGDRTEAFENSEIGKMMDTFHQGKIARVGSRMDTLYEEEGLPAGTDVSQWWVFIWMWIGAKKYLLWLAGLLAIVIMFYYGWYMVTTFITFFILGRELGIKFVGGRAKTIISLTENGEITPYGVGAELWKTLPRSRDPVHPYPSATGHPVYLLWNFRYMAKHHLSQKMKPLKFAESHFHDYFVALFNMLEYNKGRLLVDELLKHELKMTMTEERATLVAKREFAPAFMDLIKGKREPNLEGPQGPRRVQEDFDKVLANLRDAELRGVQGGPGSGEGGSDGL